MYANAVSSVVYRINMNYWSWLINSDGQISVVVLLVLEPLVFLSKGKWPSRRVSV